MVEVRVYRVTRPQTLSQVGRWLEPGELVELEVAQALTTFRGIGLQDAETGARMDDEPVSTEIAEALALRDKKTGTRIGVGTALDLCRRERLTALRAHLQAGGSLPRRPAITVPVRQGGVEGMLRPSKTQNGLYT